MLNVVMLNVVMLNAAMLNAAMLNAVMLSIVAPLNVVVIVPIYLIGSLNPWVEAILLLKGASDVTTFDYNKITSYHPQVWHFIIPT